jgi:hypothetical protein
MKIHLVNYADKTHLLSQQKNSHLAIKVGGFDNIFSFGRSDIDPIFVEKNKNILNENRGAGFWMWKPYVIRKALDLIEENEILFYSDSGIDFISNINELLPILDTTAEKLLLFELGSDHPNKRWIKKDCFVLMNADTEEYANKPQILASYIIMRKNNFTISFIDKWLQYAQDYRIITDAPNECGLSNYPEFVDHRHDQSILSLLAYQHNIKAIPDISQYGENRRITSQILNHHRTRE